MLLRIRKTRTLGSLTFGAAVLGLVARYSPVANRAVLAAAAVFPYLLLAGPVSVALLAATRRWLLAGAAGTVTATAIATQIPLYLPDKGPRTGVRLRVMSANLLKGSADPESLVGSADDWADILAVQELTPGELDRLSTAGLDKAFPYRLVDRRRPRAYGIGLWSRYPLSQTPTINNLGRPFLGATIRLPGVGAEPVIVVAHLANPYDDIRAWANNIDQLAQTLREADGLADGGAAIFAGDFNSTLDMRPFRDLLRRGYRDAVAAVGAGFAPTFPTDRPTPPLVAIDHVLTLRCTPVAACTLPIAGSDHRGLAVTLTIPPHRSLPEPELVAAPAARGPRSAPTLT